MLLLLLAHLPHLVDSLVAKASLVHGLVLGKGERTCGRVDVGALYYLALVGKYRDQCLASVSLLELPMLLRKLKEGALILEVHGCDRVVGMLLVPSLLVEGDEAPTEQAHRDLLFRFVVVMLYLPNESLILW